MLGHLAGLLSTCGGEERLLVLIVIGHHEAAEPRRDALLADEEVRQAPGDLVAGRRPSPPSLEPVLRESISCELQFWRSQSR